MSDTVNTRYMVVHRGKILWIFFFFVAHNLSRKSVAGSDWLLVTSHVGHTLVLGRNAQTLYVLYSCTRSPTQKKILQYYDTDTTLPA